MRYRYSVGKRVAGVLGGLTLLLLGVLAIVMAVIDVVDPTAIGGAGVPAETGPIVLFSILFCVFAAMACLGFAQVKATILARLDVTRDGLISREAGFTYVRTTTIPWSSITSFTVTDVGTTPGQRGRRHVVCAILDSDKPVALTGTERWRIVAAAAIAEELITTLDEHQAGSRPKDQKAAGSLPGLPDGRACSPGP